MKRRGARWVVAALALPSAFALLFFLMPRIVGAGWDETSDRVAGVPLPQIWQLVAVWAAGLWLHTFVLRASLPGLGTRRALALNLGGSSVSNVLPMGGAAGVGLNYAMLRSWGYSRTQISAFTTVSNLVVATVKLVMATAGLVAVLTMPAIARGLPVRPFRLLPVAAGVLAVVATATVLVARSPWGRTRLVGVRVAGRQAYESGADALRRGWHLLTVGGVGYPALQALLLWLCLTAVGASVSIVVALVAYAVERLATLLPFTPGGVGVVETAMTAALVALGTDPAAAAASVLVFRAFSFLIEIPLGGVIAMVWMARRRRGAVGSAVSA